MSTGYSGTPLAKKLGIRPGFSIYLRNQPTNYLKLFTEFPPDVTFLENTQPEIVDFIHAFFVSHDVMIQQGALLMKALKKTGMLWVSWPKGSSDLTTDLKREPIREHFLAIGLVDIKVAAIDENWSGLKFVYRTKDR